MVAMHAGVPTATEQPDAEMEAEEAGLVSFLHFNPNACPGAP
jgi:hypothetical protein